MRRTDTVRFSCSWSMPSLRTWLSRLTEPRLQTATSSAEVLSVISVQRFEECTTPTCCCGERRLHGSLKVIHGMAGLEQHGQHPPPEVDGAHLLEDAHLAAGGLRLVRCVGARRTRPVEVVQVRRLVGREQRPGAVLGDALHEQVRHPVRRVHVVRAAAVVAGVLAQVEELLDVDVPGLEIGADGALALAALVDGDRGVVGDLEERHDALALAVGALDVRAEAAHAASSRYRARRSIWRAARCP